MSEPTDCGPSCPTLGATGLPELADLAVLVRSTVADVADRHDLTPMQGRLLCLLLDGPLRMAELARRLGVEKAALTGLVDRAERRSLVERRAVPGDRRAVLVALSDAGTSAVSVFHADAADALDAMLGDLTEEERAAFRRMAATVVASASASASASAVG
ncbi:hypothetical protein GCM10009809_00940 [Isoptericola hypogeus]|uniref:HTH marR-type domain-containing protein n=1 Tax=Isoptericola hypogeus TaxID=300179 RepID=A0ABN2INC4_9MICO